MDIERKQDNVIKITGLHKHFGSLAALQGIDFEIRPSEVVCIIGPSGSGKRRCSRCMAFLEEYTAGEVEIEGQLLGFRRLRTGLCATASSASMRCGAMSAWCSSTSIYDPT